MYERGPVDLRDYLPRYKRVPLAIEEAKAQTESAADVTQQAYRYARWLDLRFSISSNGAGWILTDNDSGEFETLYAPPSPESIMTGMGCIH
jgi:type I restriction enzyme R subunit